MHIIFNPKYTLKPDYGKALLMAAMPGRAYLYDMDSTFTMLIHPIYAMILSYVDGREMSECINEAADFLGISSNIVERFILNLLDNPSDIYLKSDKSTSAFPAHTIISTHDGIISRRYNPSDFEYEVVDIQMTRHCTPSTVTLMVNNICTTSCIYCYQDKSKFIDCKIPLERIKEIIEEAKSLNVNAFDVIGGEFFLYPHWREVLMTLKDNGFNPYLSTKIALSESDIKVLSDLDILDIQISLDSGIEESLIKSIKVQPGYLNKIERTLRQLDSSGIKLMIHTVLTQYNDTVEDIRSVYDILKTLSNLVEWHVVKGTDTLYPTTSYDKIEISNEKYNLIVDYLTELRDQLNFPVKVPEKITLSDSTSIQESLEEKIDKFFNRTFCSGLFSSIYILPDGNVTMCEQLYWNKNFIVGNILEKSLIEIWNSDIALNIFDIKQSSIPADSQCHSCAYFEKCRKSRQVCYREIVKKYGHDKWYYPDVNCPIANRYL